jgi:hypothetical protein
MRSPMPILAALALALTGCSDGSPDGAENPSDGVTTPDIAGTTTTPSGSIAGGLPTAVPAMFPLKQEFYLETSRGAKVLMSAPVPASPEINSLRNHLKINQGSYLAARIDNRLGSGTADLESVTLYDSAGNTHRFTPVATSHIPEWGPLMTDQGSMLVDGTSIDQDRYRTMSTLASDLQTKLSAGIEEGAEGSTWLRSESTNLPDEVVRVMVKARGTPSPIHAYPKGIQGYSTE